MIQIATMMAVSGAHICRRRTDTAIRSFRAAMWCVSRIPRFKDFNAEMARRMNEDLVFDTSAAERDFGFAPRTFQPQPLRADPG